MRIPWPGRTRIDQGRAVGIWRLGAIVLLLVAGCARAGSHRSSADSATTSISPATVTVGPRDDGRTVDLKVADRLVVELPTAKQPSRFPSAWTLGSLPPKVLKRVQGDSSATRVVFVAQGPGTVRLFLVKRQGCYPPLRRPLASAAGSSKQVRPPLPPVVVTITVRVR
jgi:hypothetical protein